MDFKINSNASKINIKSYGSVKNSSNDVFKDKTYVDNNSSLSDYQDIDYSSSYYSEDEKPTYNFYNEDTLKMAQKLYKKAQDSISWFDYLIFFVEDDISKKIDSDTTVIKNKDSGNIRIKTEYAEYYYEDGLCVKIKYSNGVCQDILYDKDGNVDKVKYYHIDSNGKKEKISIFGDYNKENYQYGGNQSAFRDKRSQLLKDPEILKMLKETFPDATMEDYEYYLTAINKVGCGYTAFVNAIFKEFEGREEEFQKYFGFPMYNVDEHGNIDYNYEYLILDLFNYVWGNSGYTIKELYGNISLSSTDGAISNQNANMVVEGTYSNLGYNWANNPRLSTYTTYVQWLGKKCGLVFSREEFSYSNFSSKVNSSDPRWMEKLKKLNITDSEINKFWKDVEIIVIDKTKLKKYILNNKDKVLLLNTSYFPLKDINGKTEYKNVGPHAMTIVGCNENGVIVSSWGSEYLILYEDLDRYFEIHELDLYK